MQLQVNRQLRAAVVLGAAVAGLVGLGLARPSLTLAAPTDDQTTLVVTAAGWAAWTLTGYLLIGVAMAAAAHLPRCPRRVRAGVRLAAPRAVRRLVDTAVGASAAAIVLSLTPVAAHADTGVPRPPVVAPPTTVATAPAAVPSGAQSPLDWPGLAAGTATPRHRQPSTPAVGLVSPIPRRAVAAAGADIVVRAGDSLWSLTERRLGAGASTAEVAAEWPRLYAANRAVIGSDPDLIHPGQRLVPPVADPRRPR